MLIQQATASIGSIATCHRLPAVHIVDYSINLEHSDSREQDLGLENPEMFCL